MWELLDADTDTRATEIPGLGTIVGVPGLGLCFVPGARLKSTGIETPSHVICRDDRTAPPLLGGVRASDIKVRPDPGAQQYIIHDDPDY